MSGFFNDTNHGRVAKMRDVVGVMNKSALSNKATPEEWAQMLQPLTQIIEGVTKGASTDFRGRVYPATEKPAAPPLAATQPRHKEPQWATIRRMAEEASLADLTVAMAVYLNRIDEELKG